MSKIRNFCKSYDSVHLCVVLGSESLLLGFNMMNPVDLSEKGKNFWNSGQLATASDHQKPRNSCQLAMSSKFTWEASCSRTWKILSENNIV